MRMSSRPKLLREERESWFKRQRITEDDFLGLNDETQKPKKEEKEQIGKNGSKGNNEVNFLD